MDYISAGLLGSNPALGPAVYTLSLEETASRSHTQESRVLPASVFLKIQGEQLHQGRNLGHHKGSCPSALASSLAEGGKANSIFLLCPNTATLSGSPGMLQTHLRRKKTEVTSLTPKRWRTKPRLVPETQQFRQNHPAWPLTLTCICSCRFTKMFWGKGSRARERGGWGVVAEGVTEDHVQSASRTVAPKLIFSSSNNFPRS